MTARVTETLSPALIPKQKGKLLLKHTSVTLLTPESAAVLTPITVRLLSTACNSIPVAKTSHRTNIKPWEVLEESENLLLIHDMFHPVED